MLIHLALAQRPFREGRGVVVQVRVPCVSLSALDIISVEMGVDGQWWLTVSFTSENLTFLASGLLDGASL